MTVYQADLLTPALTTDGFRLSEECIRNTQAAAVNLPVTLNFQKLLAGKILSASIAAGGRLRVIVELPQVDLSIAKETFYLVPLGQLHDVRLEKSTGFRVAERYELMGASVVSEPPWPEMMPMTEVPPPAAPVEGG